MRAGWFTGTAISGATFDFRIRSFSLFFSDWRFSWASLAFLSRRLLRTGICRGRGVAWLLGRAFVPYAPKAYSQLDTNQHSDHDAYTLQVLAHIYSIYTFRGEDPIDPAILAIIQTSVNNNNASWRFVNLREATRGTLRATISHFFTYR